MTRSVGLGAILLVVVGCGRGTDAPSMQGGVIPPAAGAAAPAVGGASAAKPPMQTTGAVMMGGAGSTGGTVVGMMKPPTGGSVAMGTGGSVATPPMMTAGSMAPPTTTPETPSGSKGTPKIPEVTGECPEFRSGTITFGGVSGIDLQAGAKASGPTAPYVSYWHGTGSFAGEYAGMASAVAQGVMQEGGVLTSFQGSSGQGDSSCSGTFIFSLGDFDITDQLVACAVKNHNVDPRRIYTTGCSAGGLMAACMAAHRSSYIAAAAPNSGGFAIPQQFEDDNTAALMTMHGGSSDVVIVNFTDTSNTADMIFKMRGGFVVACDHGGTHCGGGGLAPDVWEFFKAHPFGVSPEPWAGGLPSGFSSQCMIYE